MQVREGIGQTLVIAGEAAKASGPREAALHDQAPRQQDKAAFRLSVFDHLQVDTVHRGRFGRCGTGIALVDMGHGHLIAGHFWHGRSDRGDLCTILRVGRGDAQGKEVAEGMSQIFNGRTST